MPHDFFFCVNFIKKKLVIVLSVEPLVENDVVFGIVSQFSRIIGITDFFLVTDMLNYISDVFVQKPIGKTNQEGKKKTESIFIEFHVI